MAQPTTPWDWVARNRGILVAIAVIALPLVIILPLPSFILDLLLSANLLLSAIILLTTLYATSPLQFSVFPSLLLITTLYRLVLNIATTRLVLSKAGERGAHAAGEVVFTFGNFVAGDNQVVGLIIFAILVVVQFVVITKGATRIAEVAARFTLDGMPGKQMAIDADLNAGLITEAQARERRTAISREADFYGAMDGASKFVRGDAVAAPGRGVKPGAGGRPRQGRRRLADSGGAGVAAERSAGPPHRNRTPRRWAALTQRESESATNLGRDRGVREVLRDVRRAGGRYPLAFGVRGAALVGARVARFGPRVQLIHPDQGSHRRDDPCDDIIRPVGIRTLVGGKGGGFALQKPDSGGDPLCLRPFHQGPAAGCAKLQVRQLLQ